MSRRNQDGICADIETNPNREEGGFRAVMIRGRQEVNGTTELDAASALARQQAGDLARVRLVAPRQYQVHFNQEEPA